MAKIVKKLKAMNQWRIGEQESWFSDMAAQGLHLQKICFYCAHCVKSAPTKREYRIEFSEKKQLNDEQLLLYEESGWLYVTSTGNMHIFVSVEEQPTVEVHTDLNEQGFTLDVLLKKMRLHAMIVIMLVLAMTILNYFTWFSDGVPIYHLINNGLVSSFISYFVIFIGVILSLSTFFAILRLRRQLAAGIPIDHHAPWRSYMRRSNLLTISYIVICLALIPIPFMQIVKMKEHTLPENNTDLPFIRLAEIEQNDALERQDYIIGDENFSNYYYTNWTPFASVQFDVTENGEIKEENYAPSLYTDYYELRFSALAPAFIEDAIDYYMFGEEKVYQKIQDPAFDLLYVYEEDGKIDLYAVKGKHVFIINYYGDVTLAQLQEVVGEKLTQLHNEL